MAIRRCVAVGRRSRCWRSGVRDYRVPESSQRRGASPTHWPPATTATAPSARSLRPRGFAPGPARGVEPLAGSAPRAEARGGGGQDAAAAVEWRSRARRPDERIRVLSLPLQTTWLLAPAFCSESPRFGAASAPLAIAATGLGALVAIAFGVARALDSGGSAPAAVAGLPWPFALAFLLAGICLGLSARHAVQREWLPAAAGGLWAALALFWLL